MCRFAPIAPSSGYFTTLWCPPGVFSRLVLRAAQSRTWLPPRTALVHRHPVSLQLSIHHLPARRLDCQLGCLDVWQKRHAGTPHAPLNSALACPAELAMQPTWHRYVHPASGQAAAPPLSAPIQAEAARKPRILCWTPVQKTKGTPRKWEPGSRLSAASGRFGIRRENTPTTASPISASQPRRGPTQRRTPRRRAPAMPLR